MCQETQRPRFASDLKLRFTGSMMFRAIRAALAAGVVVLGRGWGFEGLVLRVLRRLEGEGELSRCVRGG